LLIIGAGPLGISLAAIARYPDEIDLLNKAGVDAAFNLYGEAGAGFADHVYDRLLAAS